MKDSELRLVSFISGGGTTMEALAKACREGTLHGKVALVGVIASKSSADRLLGALCKNRWPTHPSSPLRPGCCR